MNLLRPRLMFAVGAVLWLLVGLTACQKAEEKPTPTPDEASIAAGHALFAQPTRDPRITPTPTPLNTVEIDLNRLIAHMEQAVLAGNVDEYMAYVWDGDPVFLADHRRWAEDWQQHPLDVFEIELFGISSLDPDTTTARMFFRWRQAGRTGTGSAGGATINAIFYRVAGDWKLGGERWHTADLPGLRLYYFGDGLLDDSAQAATVIDYLPDLHTTLTRAFDFVPQQTANIKLYENAAMLQNWTRLSMPDITVWNEPGESIKLTLTPIMTAPYEIDVAREYTRFMLFEMSGGSHSGFPWWVEDGIAEYGASLFRTLSQRNRIFKAIAGLAVAPVTAEEHLIPWSVLDDPAALTPDQHAQAINQAYTLVHYINERYGADALNAWIRAIAGGQTVEAACDAALGVTFSDLDDRWRAWLPSQL